jgi:hypothetical protein
MQTMKRILLFVTLISSLSVAAGNPDSSSYCAELRDGIMVLTQDGRKISTMVQLADGTQITTDCVIVKRDGTRQPMQDGQCISENGNMVLPVQGKKEKKSKTSKNTGKP